LIEALPEPVASRRWRTPSPSKQRPKALQPELCTGRT